MSPLTSTPARSATEPAAPAAGAPDEASVRPWRLNLLRGAYAFVAAGTAAVQWPALLSHDASWPLMAGVKTSMLAAVSLLAVLGIRYPLRLLPVLLFEVAWKVIWFVAVAAPLWAADQLDPATRQVASDCLWVVVVVAAVPWRHVVARYVVRRGEPWRSR